MSERTCPDCQRRFVGAHALGQHRAMKHGAADNAKPRPMSIPARPEDTAPDWNRKCIVCRAVPTLPLTRMCGPCTFGEAETAGGNW